MTSPPESPPAFWFPSTPDREGPGFLVGPDAWMVQDGDGTTWVQEGVDLDTGGDAYRVLDRFFRRFEEGVLAGWLSYELAHEQHTIGPLPGDPFSIPRLVLAHYPGGSSASPPGEVPSLGRFRPTVPRREYRRDVDRIREKIQDGYVYQVNYSQRFTTRCSGTLRGLAGELGPGDRPPHTAGAFLGSLEALSLSPERFLRVEGDRILTQPIKGTRPRSPDPEEDRRLREELRTSGKDRAEHVMIVDLERNDLNRICRTGSVRASELCRLRRFGSVHHLVSTVEGRLQPAVTPGSIFRNMFPGGSVTGAPKSTALRVIHDLENRRRGLYTGSLGFWDRDRSVADWNLAIRTLVRRGGRAYWDAGGGIVYDSDPASEHRECLDKVQAVRRFESERRPAFHPGP